MCSDVSLGLRVPVPRSGHVSRRNTPGLEGQGEPVTWVSTAERSFASRWFDDPCGLVSPGGEDARPRWEKAPVTSLSAWRCSPGNTLGAMGPDSEINQPAIVWEFLLVF